MLKFTKYGRTDSTSSYSADSGKKKLPEVFHGTFPDVTTKTFEGKAQIRPLEMCCSKRQESPEPKQSIKSLTSLPDSKPYLLRSKVSKQELMKLDSEEVDLRQQTSSMVPNQLRGFKMELHPDNHLSGRLKISSTFRNSKSRIKVPVLNDGYFPRVHPLTKLFVMRQQNLKSCSNIK